MSDEQLLKEALDALQSFTGDLRWGETWQGKTVSALAQRLGLEDPFKEYAE